MNWGDSVSEYCLVENWIKSALCLRNKRKASRRIDIGRQWNESNFSFSFSVFSEPEPTHARLQNHWHRLILHKKKQSIAIRCALRDESVAYVFGREYDDGTNQSILL